MARNKNPARRQVWEQVQPRSRLATVKRTCDKIPPEVGASYSVTSPTGRCAPSAPDVHTRKLTASVEDTERSTTYMYRVRRTEHRHTRPKTLRLLLGWRHRPGLGRGRRLVAHCEHRKGQRTNVFSCSSRSASGPSGVVERAALPSCSLDDWGPSRGRMRLMDQLMLPVSPGGSWAHGPGSWHDFGLVWHGRVPAFLHVVCHSRRDRLGKANGHDHETGAPGLAAMNDQ